MASQEHSWSVARSLVLTKASYELQIPKSANSILSPLLNNKRFVLVSNEMVLSIQKKQKQKTKTSCGNRNLNFLSFSTGKHNVYNIYVAINVPSFFKLNCMWFYFFHWTKKNNPTVSSPHLILSMWWTGTGRMTQGELRNTEANLNLFIVLLFSF